MLRKLQLYHQNGINYVLVMKLTHFIRVQSRLRILVTKMFGKFSHLGNTSFVVKNPYDKIFSHLWISRSRNREIIYLSPVQIGKLFI